MTDVRQWFLFSASERWRDDDTEYEHYTDSAGKSGGQKEKLAYTILAASLAYQFKLDWGAARSKAFRFVVIDEAFGRGSEISTRVRVDVSFTRLGLQLLIVTPLQKIHVIEPYVSAVGFGDVLRWGARRGGQFVGGGLGDGKAEDLAAFGFPGGDEYGHGGGLAGPGRADHHVHIRPGGKHLADRYGLIGAQLGVAGGGDRLLDAVGRDRGDGGGLAAGRPGIPLR